MASPLYESGDYWKEVQKVSDELGKQVEGSSRVEIRLMGLEMLPRLIVCLRHLSSHCSECKAYSEKLDVYVLQLHDLIVPENKEIRRQFEALADEIIAHIEQTHQMMPKGKMFSRIVLWSMLLGVLSGGVFYWIFSGIPVSTSFVLGWLGGLVIGYVTGKLVEVKMKQQNRLF